MDKALEDTYGFDVYGLDSEWRMFLGVEPLPRPEVPAPQPRATSTPRPTPTPLAAAAAPSPTPLPPPLPIAAATPPPTAQPEPVADAGNESPSSSPGCAAPSHQGGALTDLALVALLGGPLGMLGFGAYRRRFTR